MKKRRFVHGAGLILLFSGLVGGCGPRNSNIATAKPTEGVADSSRPARVAAPPPPPVSTKRVTDRPAYPNGKVFVVEYHHIRDGKGGMFRTVPEFKGDLERFYKDGFRPVTVSEYLSNRMTLPPGASPMVFTFDDANPSQIKFRDDGSLDPDCALGIWQEFAKSHPDFPIRATFYVLPNMWNQPKWVEKKIELVHSLGCEMADHTITHPILRKLNDDKVKWEIGEAWLRLEKYGEKPPFSLAFPYGSSPRNKALAQGFDYKGQHLDIKAAMLVGAEPAPSPTDPKFNRYRIPRIQANHELDGIDYWMDQFEKGRVKPYVAG